MRSSLHYISRSTGLAWSELHDALRTTRHQKNAVNWTSLFIAKQRQRKIDIQQTCCRPSFTSVQLTTTTPRARNRSETVAVASASGRRTVFLIMKKSKTTEKKCRIVVMGASGVGKTSLISQLLGNGCPQEHEETVEEMYHSELRMPAAKYNLEILDTTGAYSFPAMRRLAINKADVFVLVFAVDSPDSLKYLKTLREEIFELREDARSKIIVAANKTDSLGTDKTVTSDEHTATMISLDWDCACVETSAKNDLGVMDLFETAVSLVHSEGSPSLSPLSSLDECSREC